MDKICNSHGGTLILPHITPVKQEYGSNQLKLLSFPFSLCQHLARWPRKNGNRPSDERQAQARKQAE